MTAELTAAERRELPDQIGSLSERAAAIAREIETAERAIEDLSDDVTAGKAGAKASVLKLTALVSEAAIERNAILNSMAKLQARWDGDAPARAREAAAARKAKATEIALRIVTPSAKVDELLAEAVSVCLAERHAAIAELQEFRDLVDRMPPEVPAVMPTVLAAAGMTKLAPFNYQLSPNGPNHLAEHDASALAALLPADHPAMVSNRARQDALHAEYRRQQGQPTEIVGPKVTVVSPGRL